ncbi:carboxylesterase family protein [Bacterioplanoides sp.]|uniref:carboxylesterase family protein n=1 Tax=Bacterioplanoides sp. TaxID=2066072 RepID=UPI003B5B51D2
MTSLTKAALVSASLILAACGSDNKKNSTENSAENPQKPAGNGLLVKTTAGTVEGFQHSLGVSRFNAIPFAEAPVNELRFSPPVAKKSWQGIRPAKEIGPRCIQVEAGINNESEHWQGGESEDCLWLDINTPATGENHKRPVIVWVYGGGFYGHGAAYPVYDAARLAKQADAVVVNIQYRMGALGWWNAAEWRGEDEITDHSDPQYLKNGQKDVILALQWVQQNINAFGGDNNNVTLMGESAGGLLVTTLMGEPQLDQLYHKVINFSGIREEDFKHGDRKAMTRRMKAELGDENMSLESLRALPVEKIIAAQQKVQLGEGFRFDQPILFNPVQRGFGREIAHYRELGERLKKPALVAYTRDEFNTFALLTLFQRTEMDAMRYQQQLAEAKENGRSPDTVAPAKNYLDANLPADEKLALYSGLAFQALTGDSPAGQGLRIEEVAELAGLIFAANGGDPAALADPSAMTEQHKSQLADAHLAVISAFAAHRPALEFADEYSKGSDVFMLSFDKTSGKYPHLGAMHGAELPYVFGNLQYDEALIGENAPRALSTHLQKLIGAFARTGNPSLPGYSWPAYEHSPANDFANSRVMRVDYDLKNDQLQAEVTGFTKPWLKAFIAKVAGFRAKGDDRPGTTLEDLLKAEAGL